MYEIEVINKNTAPKWMWNSKELRNQLAEYWEKQGAITLIRKFRYVPKYKKCECGATYKHRKRIAWKKLKRPKRVDDEWD